MPSKVATEHLPGELGDLLFQVVYYSQLAREEGRFDFATVVDAITRKLVRRHPHVFPDGDPYGSPELPRLDEAAIKRRWEEIKAEERAEKAAAPRAALLDDVPSALPALSRAAKLQKRAAQVGFDWPEALPVVDKVREELDEVLEAMSENDPQAIAEEPRPAVRGSTCAPPQGRSGKRPACGQRQFERRAASSNRLAGRGTTHRIATSKSWTLWAASAERSPSCG